MDLQLISVINHQVNVTASKELADTSVINVQGDGWERRHIVHHVANVLIIGTIFLMS
jgi:hypothetical protein